MNRWEAVQLGELFQLKHGYAFKSEYFTPDGPHVCLTPGNFEETGGFKNKGDKEKGTRGRYPMDSFYHQETSGNLAWPALM